MVLGLPTALRLYWKVRVGSFAWYDAFGANYFLPDVFHRESDATLSSFLIDPTLYPAEPARVGVQGQSGREP